MLIPNTQTRIFRVLIHFHVTTRALRHHRDRREMMNHAPQISVYFCELAARVYRQGLRTLGYGHCFVRHSLDRNDLCLIVVVHIEFVIYCLDIESIL